MSFSLTRRAEVPERSVDQRREALAQANRVRTNRARIKEDLKQGRVSLADLLADPPPYLSSAKVMELLRALPGYGPIKATRLLERCQVSPTKTVGGLTERQRTRLFKSLRQQEGRSLRLPARPRFGGQDRDAALSPLPHHSGA